MHIIADNLITICCKKGKLLKNYLSKLKLKQINIHKEDLKSKESTE